MTIGQRSALVDAYERLVEEIGRSAPPVHGEARQRDIERYALACGEPLAAVGPGAPAPPLYLPSVQEWGPGATLGDLRTDGTGADRTAFLELDGFRLMGGGQDLTFHRPFHGNDTVTIQTTLEDVALKDGRAGTLVLITLQSQYFDGEGHLVTMCRDTIVVR